MKGATYLCDIRAYKTYQRGDNKKKKRNRKKHDKIQNKI